MIRVNALDADKKRLLQVTAGNVRHNHVYVNGHYDFFPPDCIGGAKRSAGCRTIDIHLDGLDRKVRTDIGRDAKTGKPRAFFRARGWVRPFFQHHGVKPGTVLALERLSERTYRLSVQPSERVTPLNAPSSLRASAWCGSPSNGRVGASFLRTTSTLRRPKCTGTTGRSITGKACSYATAFRRVATRRHGRTSDG